MYTIRPEIKGYKSINTTPFHLLPSIVEMEIIMTSADLTRSNSTFNILESICTFHQGFGS